MLSLNTKNLSFFQTQRSYAYQLLQKALSVSSLSVNLNIKKENVETVADGHRMGLHLMFFPNFLVGYPSLDSECVVQQAIVTCADNEMSDDAG